MMFAPLLVAPVLVQAGIDDPLASESYVYAPRDEAVATLSGMQRMVVEGDELRATGRRSLPRALAAAAGSGLWLQETNLGGGTAFLRGVTGNQVLLLIDGVRLNDSTTRFGPNQILNTIDPAIVERIEITRGPASVLYGSDAIGGAIHIHTRRQKPVAEGEYLGAALDLDVSSSVMGGRVSPQGAWADGTDGVLAIGSLADYQDLWTAEGVVEDTGYDGSAAFLAWVRDLGRDRELSVSAWMHRDNDVPRTDKLVVGFGQTNPSNDVWTFGLQDRRQVLFTYTDEAFDLGFADTMQARLSLRSYDEERERQDFGSTTYRFERDEVESIGASVEWTRAVGDDHLLTFGLDVDHDQVDSTRTDTDTITSVATVKDGQFAPDADYTGVGVFLQDEWSGWDPVDVTAGLRFSTFSFGFDGFGGGPSECGDFSALTASVQAARDLAEGHRVSATLAQGFRAPNLDDLAKEGSFGGGTELPNADLDPETSLTLELGYDFVGDGSAFSVAVFGTEIRDVVGRRLQDAGTPAAGDEIYLRDNAGEVRLAGIEVGGMLDLSGTWSLDYGAAFVRGRQDDETIDGSSGTAPFDDVDWRRVPPLHGTVGLTYTPHDPLGVRDGHGSIGPGFEALRVSVTAADRQDFLHPQDISDPRIDPDGTPGWARLDLDLWGPIGEQDPDGLGGSSSWILGFHNITDTAYRPHGSSFDGAGFTMSVGVHLAL